MAAKSSHAYALSRMRAREFILKTPSLRHLPTHLRVHHFVQTRIHKNDKYEWFGRGGVSWGDRHPRLYSLSTVGAVGHYGVLISGRTETVARASVRQNRWRHLRRNERREVTRAWWSVSLSRNRRIFGLSRKS